MISDMTKGNPLKLILSFSVPMLIGNIFQQVYNFVDAAIVGKFVGAESLAAVGSTGTIVGVMICLMMGLTSGAGIIIAQCFGSRNFEKTYFIVRPSGTEPKIKLYLGTFAESFETAEKTIEKVLEDCKKQLGL